MRRPRTSFGIIGAVSFLLALTSCTSLKKQAATQNQQMGTAKSPQQFDPAASKVFAGPEGHLPNFLLGSGLATFHSKPIIKGKAHLQKDRELPKEAPVLQQAKAVSLKPPEKKPDVAMSKASVKTVTKMPTA